LCPRPAIFGIFFALLLKKQEEKESICVRDQMAGFSILPGSEPRPKYANMRFADDAAVATHTQRELQSLMDQDGTVQWLCHQHTAIR